MMTNFYRRNVAFSNFKGDFSKGSVFVEVQFGNSATLFRDYYKFQYGYKNALLKTAVLIVPENPKQFFPTRPASVQNMADFKLACKILDAIDIGLPVIVYALLAEN